jgi:hypothetical protein
MVPDGSNTSVLEDQALGEEGLKKYRLLLIVEVVPTPREVRQ